MWTGSVYRTIMKGGIAVRKPAEVLFIFLIFILPVFAENEAPVFTDQDLEKYGGSGGSTSSSPDQATSLQGNGKEGAHTLSPLESDLRRRKDDVVQENLDYIEGQYQWMKTDCQQFEGELKKDCFFQDRGLAEGAVKASRGLKGLPGQVISRGRRYLPEIRGSQ